jgi:hypothetical protein
MERVGLGLESRGEADLPTLDHEVPLKAMRVAGDDSFNVLVLPVGDTHVFWGVTAGADTLSA